LIGYFIFTIFNLFDAHRCAKRSNSNEFEMLRKSEKDPWLAVFLSRIFPGLGHAYQGNWLFAFWFFVLIIGAGVLAEISPLFGLLSIGMLYLCFYHAYISSPDRRAKSRRLILGICLAFLVGQFLAFSIREFVAEARYIPVSSMMPTLQINDRLVVDKLGYRFKLPQRGDIIVFNPTATLEQQNFKDAFIKRIVGLPGETLEVKAGKVYINGQPLPEDYISEPPKYNYGPTKIPPNSYFVLGDNRNNSFDSHYWGFVPQDRIIGRATKIFWPPARSGAIK
jgi:signal peptidase I